MNLAILFSRVASLYRSLTCLPVSIGVPLSMRQINNCNPSFHHRHSRIVIKLNRLCSVNPERLIFISTVSLEKDGVKHEISPIDNVAHKSKESHLCSECNETFSTLNAFTWHIRAVHRGEMPFQCPECFTVFTNFNDPKTHICEDHHKENPFQCPECSRAFSQLDHLKQHIRIVHRRKRSFQCPEYSKIFTQ